MRYFYQVASGAVVVSLMEQIARHPELWDANKTRTTFEGTPHADVSDILLRFGKLAGDGIGDDLEAIDLPAMTTLRNARQIALGVMQLVGGTRLGRVVVTKLEPGKKILPHADVRGAYASYYTRYHVVLLGLPGSLFTCGDETVSMLTGEVWWFSAKDEHSLANNSKDDRVHMLVDVRVD